MSEYPVMKKQVGVGKILNFTSVNQKYKVIGCDGVRYGEKGYALECLCIDSPSKSMIGEKYTFDDRAFRDYNENHIVVEDEAPNTGKVSLSVSSKTVPALFRSVWDGGDDVIETSCVLNLDNGHVFDIETSNGECEHLEDLDYEEVVFCIEGNTFELAVEIADDDEYHIAPDDLKAALEKIESKAGIVEKNFFAPTGAGNPASSRNMNLKR